VYPVTENDLTKEKPVVGNPVKNGYNSHLALVAPETEEIVSNLGGPYIAQFVIEQRSQIIPAFIVQLK